MRHLQPVLIWKRYGQLRQRHAHGLGATCIKKSVKLSLSANRRALYYLEPMLIEHGLDTLPSKRDRLALDEPNAGLLSPT